MLLGSCSSVIAPALLYYRPSMALCAALLQAFHGLMHKLHSLHPCNLAIAEAKLALALQTNGTICPLYFMPVPKERA